MVTRKTDTNRECPFCRSCVMGIKWVPARCTRIVDGPHLRCCGSVHAQLGASGNGVFGAVVAWTGWISLQLNRRLTDDEVDPAITVYFERSRDQFTFFDLVVKNVGRGIARNVTFVVVPDTSLSASQEHRLAAISMFQRGIPRRARC
jgi:hypothetical protein